MDPCRQEPRINHIEDHLAEILKEIRDDQRESRKVLEQLVRQTGRIENLEGGVIRQEKINSEIFRRLRDVEAKPAQAAGKFFWIFVTSGAGCVGGILSGVTVWLIRGG